MAAIDTFNNQDRGITSPASNAEAIVPHDVDEMDSVSREIYIGGTGDLAVVFMSGQEVTLVGVPAGTRLPYRIKQVKATGTTATALVAVY